jgi:hypothetical protein
MEDDELLNQNEGALAQPGPETSVPPDPRAEAEYQANIRKQEAAAAKRPVLKPELSAADVDAKIGGGGGSSSNLGDADIDRITGAPPPGTPESMRSLFQPARTVSGSIGHGLAQSAAETAVGTGQRVDEALNYFYGPDIVRRSFRRGPSGTAGDIKVTQSPPVRDMPSGLSWLDKMARGTRKGTWLDALARKESEGPISSAAGFAGDLAQIAAASALTRSPIVGGGLYGVTRPADTPGDVAINTAAGALIPAGLKGLSRAYPALGTPTQIRAGIAAIASRAADLAGRISARLPIPRNAANSTMKSAIARVEAQVPEGAQRDALDRITGRINSAIAKGPNIGAQQMTDLMEEVSTAEHNAIENGHRELSEGVKDLREELQNLVANRGGGAARAQFDALNAQRSNATRNFLRSTQREAQQTRRGPLQPWAWAASPLHAAGHVGAQIATRAGPAFHRTLTQRIAPALLGAEGMVKGAQTGEQMKEGGDDSEN